MSPPPKSDSGSQNIKFLEKRRIPGLKHPLYRFALRCPVHGTVETYLDAANKLECPPCLNEEIRQRELKYIEAEMEERAKPIMVAA